MLTERSIIDEVGKIGAWSKFVIGKAVNLIFEYKTEDVCTRKNNNFINYAVDKIQHDS